MKEFAEFVQTVGLPGAVLIYLLFRFEKILLALEKAITGRGGMIDKQDDSDAKIFGKDGFGDKINANTNALKALTTALNEYLKGN